ncbi:MAG: hypothetical protein ACOYLS_15305 [Polymorphobacter sp.]
MAALTVLPQVLADSIAAITRRWVEARGCRPRRKSKTKRGSPITSRPNRDGAIAARRKCRSTAISKLIFRSPFDPANATDSASLTFYPSLNPTSLGKKL